MLGETSSFESAGSEVLVTLAQAAERVRRGRQLPPLWLRFEKNCLRYDEAASVLQAEEVKVTGAAHLRVCLQAVLRTARNYADCWLFGYAGGAPVQAVPQVTWHKVEPRRLVNASGVPFQAFSSARCILSGRRCAPPRTRGEHANSTFYICTT